MNTKPSKEKLSEIRTAMNEALSKVAKEYGIENFNIGTIRFDADGFRTSIEAKFVGGESLDMKSLRMNAQLLGFKPEIAGATINYANKNFVVTGLKRTKLTLENEGKTYTGSIDNVVRTLKRQNSPLLLEEPKTTISKQI